MGLAPLAQSARPPRTSVGCLIVAFAALAAGCGGGEAGEAVASLEGTSAATTTAAAAGEVDLEEALLDFTACMREEGVALPDPQLDADGNLKLVSFMAEAGRVVEDAGGFDAVREAAEACRSHLSGVALRFASIDRTAMQDRMLSYARCVREHGFDLPDPDFTGGIRGGPFPGLGLDVFEDPDFLEANEACQGIFAGLLPGGTEAPGGG
jgi:hypothetical protein